MAISHNLCEKGLCFELNANMLIMTKFTILIFHVSTLPCVLISCKRDVKQSDGNFIHFARVW